ncbi:MAG: hypothetical protein E2598_11255 [Sphingobium sp.]|nr:hypothetical protein [Sphingobium sp.]
MDQSDRDIFQGKIKTGWGWVLAYAVLVTLIGVLALTNPVITGLATGVMLGVTLLIYGGFAIAAGISSLKGRARWLELLLGALALITAFIVLINPFAGALSLVWAIGAWLLIAGILEIISAVKTQYDRGWRLFLGVLDSILGGFLLFSSPATGLSFLAAIVGISFLFRGVFLAMLALGLRRIGKDINI